MPIVVAGVMIASAAQTAMIAVTIAATAATIAAQNANSKAQASAISKQNQLQADQITKSNAQAMSVNEQKAYAERGAMRAGAADSGINLGSGSFLAAMQTSAINESNTNGLIVANNSSQQAARQASASSEIAGLPHTSGLSAALQIGAAGTSAYMAGAKTPGPASTGAAATLAPK